VRSHTRFAIRLLIGGWVALPAAALALAVATGGLTLMDAGGLTAWLILPWAVVLVGLVLVRSALGPGPGRRA